VKKAPADMTIFESGRPEGWAGFAQCIGWAEAGGMAGNFLSGGVSAEKRGGKKLTKKQIEVTMFACGVGGWRGGRKDEGE